MQLRQRLIAAISEGRLQGELRLPSSRRLAATLGIGRNTVTLAYQQLLDEGVLVSRERSGIFVAANFAAVARPLETSGVSGNWQPELAFRPSLLRQIVKPRDWTSFPFPFLFGQFDDGLFPVNDWRESVRAASSATEISDWSMDGIDADDSDLVAEIVGKVLPRRGVWATPSEVVVTLGAQQALYMVARLVAGPGATVGIEDPCYPDLRNMLEIGGARQELLSMDRQGVVPDARFEGCGAVFLTPNHQCPTTVSMEPERREAVLAAAARTGAIVVEDDYEADLFAETLEPQAALKSVDLDKRVIYVGSLSKSLAPGLRLGFVVARPDIADELRALRRIMLRHPPANNQRAMAMFISLGHYRNHLRRLASVLIERARRIESRLPELPGGFLWRRGAGATSFWVVGPDGFDARAMAGDAREAGVLVEPGDVFHADPATGRSTFRLGFAAIRAERIDEGLDRLFHAVRQAMGARAS